jgi:hypothetical protein
MENDMTMETAIAELIEAIRADYLTWTTNRGRTALSDVAVKMVKEFNEGISVEHGRKYIKIVSRGSVWGFIVATEGDKFPRGTILKAASWATPARNHARGNVLEGGYTIQWTGPLYMN